MINIDLNFKRLCDEPYSIEKVFRNNEYDWPGDYEGRALLAFTCHYEISKKAAPSMHKLVELLPEKTNSKLYFGKEFDGITVDEQQLSGHNWYLRGLLKYSDNFDNKFVKEALKSTVENLYLPMINWFSHYPLERESYNGDVSGNASNTISGWKLSTDIGCAFMCVDGLSKYFLKTKDIRVKEFLDVAIDTFSKIDIVKYKFQTHTSLSCMRGILTMYEATKDEKYLNLVKEKFDLYQKYGMTLTYENYNWFNRKDTWTEPCAVVDSFILSIELYEITRDEYYRTLSRRIWFNGLQFSQRINGGAGPNTCVTKTNKVLKVSMYEAHFCCTMRYAEGLLYYNQRKDWFSISDDEKETTDEYGRHFIGDRLLVQYKNKIVPIFSLNTIKKEEAENIELKVIY